MTGILQARRDRDTVIIWAVAVSVLLHAVLLAPWLRGLAKKVDLNIKPLPASSEIEFQLVSPPEHPTPPDKRSRFLSTVSSALSDPTHNAEASDVPHSEGKIPIVDTPGAREGAEGGGTSDVPPLPETIGDLSDAFQRSRFIQQQSPQREPSRPEQNPEYRNKGSARASIGGISLNTTAWDFAPYLLDLKHRIKNNWVPPLAFTALGAIHGYTWVRFRIYPDGRLAAVKVEEAKGHDSLRRSSVNAIRGAVPFRPLPDDFPEKYLEVRFGFFYLLPGDEDRFFKKQERSTP